MGMGTRVREDVVLTGRSSPRRAEQYRQNLFSKKKIAPPMFCLDHAWSIYARFQLPLTDVVTLTAHYSHKDHALKHDHINGSLLSHTLGHDHIDGSILSLTALYSQKREDTTL